MLMVLCSREQYSWSLDLKLCPFLCGKHIIVNLLKIYSVVIDRDIIEKNKMFTFIIIFI